MQDTEILHASTVAAHGAAAVILGQSGSGKSGLAMQLMGFGAELVADDHTVLTLEAGQVIASAPSTIRGLIEARGIGILRAAACGPTPVRLFVDLDCHERERLPEYHVREALGIEMPCLHKTEAPHFAASIMQFLKAGRKDPAPL